MAYYFVLVAHLLLVLARLGPMHTDQKLDKCNLIESTNRVLDEDCHGSSIARVLSFCNFSIVG